MKLLKIFALCLLLTSFPARAEQGYSVLQTPQPVESGKKIEVLEFFYFGCIHCYDLQSHLEPWLKKMPRDVEFRYVPTIFDDAWAPLARTFYALDVLGIEGKFHSRVYDAVMRQKIDLSEPNTMFSWAAKQGIDRKKFIDAYNSFGVDALVKKSKQMTRSYTIEGTPTLIVDGKYATSPSQAKSIDGAITQLDNLVKIARQDRAKTHR